VQATVVPELPDVEAFRRRFARYAVGRSIAEVVVTDAGILRNVSAAELDRALRGLRFDEPERRGKWLIGWTDGTTPLIHFGMTGDIGWASTAEGRHVHDRVIVVLDRGEIRYRNMRKLGGLWLARDATHVDALLGSLGPDALHISRRDFLNLLERRRGGIKAALMDQTFLAGVGNLLSDEVLWQARIHPLRAISELSTEERSRLYRSLRTVIGRTVDRYPEGYETRWTSARGRPMARCPRCRTELARTVAGGRTTYFCPNCQAGRNRSALHVSSSAT
jgi:formamidopyrimidine-DNA glycosylase